MKSAIKQNYLPMGIINRIPLREVSNEMGSSSSMQNFNLQNSFRVSNAAQAQTFPPIRNLNFDFAAVQTSEMGSSSSMQNFNLQNSFRVSNVAQTQTFPPIRNLNFDFAAVQTGGPSVQVPHSGKVRDTVNPKSRVTVVSGQRRNSNKRRNENSTAPPANVNERANPFPSYHDMGDPTFICSHCHAHFWYDERIEKYKKNPKTPVFSLCCAHGKIVLPKIPQPPQKFKDLLYGNDAKSKKFQGGMRMYNMMFSFTSIGGKIDRSFNTGRSAPIFRLNGENYHLMGSLEPYGTDKVSFAQLYIFDTDNEVKHRINSVRSDPIDDDAVNDDALHSEIIKILKDLLDEHNVLVRSFRCARDKCEQDKTADVKLRLISRRNSDGRIHNLPQASEVAALIVGDIEDLEKHRDIIVERRSGQLKRISELHSSYLPLQYPLFFLYGEDGFRENIKHCKTSRSRETKDRDVTMREYFAYRLVERLSDSPHIFFGRRLFQQFIVDAYTMVESFRLTYMRHHQKDLRCDSYAALGDALSRGESDPSLTGKRIILPSSFVGGARYMIQNYHDAMAVCRWIGYPNLFITFTCKPKWAELERYLKERGLSATDRPDIVARFFHAKLDNFMRDIRHENIFGETAAVIYTIEFQKRGLTHAHILLFMKNFPQSPTADVVDALISAEIPNPVDDREYYDAVEEFMMHGPCGTANKKSPCMNGSKCTKHFPKRFVNTTTVDEDGFVVYKRRNNGNTVQKNGIELDNRHVVPHNSTLLKKYRAHINVEWCNRSRSIKYLFKYVHKGNDRTTAVFYQSNGEQQGIQPVDEIMQYLDCRYVSAMEASWRLFAYEIHFMEPNVVRLKFHLKDEQTVVYKDGSNFGEVVANSSSKETMFTSWMIANKTFPEAKKLTYAEFPTQFVWDDQANSWRPRKQGFAIGRLNFIYPGSGEKYYMRMLLNYVRGPESFEEIAQFNGEQFKTFKEACYARGLLEDDNEYVHAITEASRWGSGFMLRSLFVNLLTSDSVVNPKKVWEECREYLMADVLGNYRKRLGRPDLTLSDVQIENLCLRDIEDLLQNKGKSLRDYPSLPFPDYVDIAFFGNPLIAKELEYDRPKLKEDHIRYVFMLNDQQLIAYNSIMEALNKWTGQVFFLYGYGGTGKTFIWNTLSAAVRSRGDIVLNVASSGIASLLLPGGRTAHSRFSIPINLTDSSTCNILQKSNTAEMISKTKLIIWDEAPMMHRNCFEALDRTLRDIMRAVNPQADRIPFGGKVVVFGGDFRQILPVIPKGTRQDIVHATINSSKLWADCKVLKLTKNMRLENAVDGADLNEMRDFANWMSSIGDGTVGEDNDGEIEVEIPHDLLIKSNHDYIGSIVEEIYPSFCDHIGDVDFLQGRAILAPTLEEVDAINDYMVSKHSTEEKIYLSADSIENSEKGENMFDQMHSVEFLNTIKCSGLPVHELKLKVGVPIMLLRNIDHAAGLCNGTRLVITQLGTYVIEARVLGGKVSEDIVYIPRMTLSPSDDRIPFRFQRRQFPVMVSYAMTINKSQGQSLSRVGIYLKKQVFTHGQLYVAISRVTNRSGLKLLCCDENGKLSNKTMNVVYKEVFHNLE